MRDVICLVAVVLGLCCVESVDAAPPGAVVQRQVVRGPLGFRRQSIRTVVSPGAGPQAFIAPQAFVARPQAFIAPQAVIVPHGGFVQPQAIIAPRFGRSAIIIR